MKVEFYVYNQYERMVLDQALTIIEAARREQLAQINAPPEEKLAQAIAADMGDAQAEESVVGPGVVGSITPQGVTKKTGNTEMAEAVKEKPATTPTITEAEIGALVQQSLDKHGLATTRELLAPITGGKRWREIDAALWPQIKAALEEAE